MVRRYASSADIDELVKAGVTHLIDCCMENDVSEMGGRTDIALLWDPTPG